MKIRFAITIALLASNMALAYGEEGAADQGKIIFESVKLGTNGKSCATCHPGGKKLEWPATYPEEKLAELSNTCITKALKGKPLAVDSDEMKNLVRYIKTFAGL